MLHIKSNYQRKLDEINNKENIINYSDRLKESSKLMLFLIEYFKNFLNKFCVGEIDIRKDYEKEYFEIIYNSLENEMIEFSEMIEKL